MYSTPVQGLASLIDFGCSEVNNNSDEFTEFRGTLFYCAPEVHFSSPYSNKIDVWSLGMVLAELLAPELYDDEIIRQNRLAFMHSDQFETFDEKINAFVTAAFDILCIIEKKYGTYSAEYNLLSRMLDTNENRRFSMKDVIKHPYFHNATESYFGLTQLHRTAIEKLAKAELAYKRIKERVIQLNDNKLRHKESIYKLKQSKKILNRARARVIKLQEKLNSFNC